MSKIVPTKEDTDFLYWLRFEWGKNGNPHAHGLAYVPGNPYFDRILRDEAQREELLKKGYAVATKETWDQAEAKIANFFDNYISEMHPAKDRHGDALYDFVIDNIQFGSRGMPQSVNLKRLLDKVFASPDQKPDHGEDAVEPDVQELKELLLALIENGQKHDSHPHGRPRIGVHACARKDKKNR